MTQKIDVILCFVKHGDRYLFLKRSGKVANYQGLWSPVAGYLKGDLREAAKKEVLEETGIKDILRIQELEPAIFEDKTLGKTWARHPCVVEVRNATVHIDWEHTDYAWLLPEEVESIQLPPGTLELFRSAAVFEEE